MTKRAVLIILVLLMLTGCGERENVDGMQVIEQFYFNNEADCNEIVKEAKAVLTKEYPSICKEEGDKFYVFAPGTDNMKSVSAHDKEYSKLIMLLTKKENEIIKRVDLDSQGINLLFSEGYYLYFCLESEENIIYPLNNSGPDNLKWEKTIKDDKILFESDHRKDHDSEDSGMYYKLELKRVKEGVFVMQLITKYPWYSVFMR